jgi:MFS family permease
MSRQAVKPRPPDIQENVLVESGYPVPAAPDIRRIILPLALAQFICSFAGSSLNVAISNIASDLGTTVTGVQTAISLFTLVMAALMIPGSVLTDIWGRKRCFMLGLIVYAAGALIASLSPGIGVLIFGYSGLQGIGTALLIPPVYILATIASPDLKSRAKAFGIISAAGAIGAATGPLIGGVLTSAISWRATFILQALIVVVIIFLAARSIADPGVRGPKPVFDGLGAVTSALGLIFIVVGILQAGTYGWFTASQDFSIGGLVIIPQGGISPVWLFVGIGALFLVWFFIHIIRRERRGKNPLISIRMFKNRTSNLGLITQIVQWLTLQGSFFVISVYLQKVRGFNAINTGLILTAATAGIIIAGALSGRFARRRSQRFLVRGGFILSVAGTIILLLLNNFLLADDATTNIIRFVPGLLLIGLGMGVMLTFSVNIVQSAFPEKDQGQISGLSRSVSNLGSSLGVALVGTIIVSQNLPSNATYGAALVAMVVIGFIGMIAAFLLPRAQRTQGQIVENTPPNPQSNS